MPSSPKPPPTPNVFLVSKHPQKTEKRSIFLTPFRRCQFLHLCGIIDVFGSKKPESVTIRKFLVTIRKFFRGFLAYMDIFSYLCAIILLPCRLKCWCLILPPPYEWRFRGIETQFATHKRCSLFVSAAFWYIRLNVLRDLWDIYCNQKRATFVRFVNLRSCVSIFVSVRKQASNRPKSVATWHLVKD